MASKSLLWKAFIILCLLSSLKSISGQSKTTIRTQLQRNVKRSERKSERLKQVINSIKTKPPYTDANGKFGPSQLHAQHNISSKHVVFAVSIMEVTWTAQYGRHFIRTARKFMDTDIVLALSPGMRDDFMGIVNKSNIIVYFIDNLDCVNIGNHPKCAYPGAANGTQRVTINMLRFQLYEYWASLYSSSTLIMITDMRDVLFQSNPFTYMTDRWAPPVSQLVVFLESFPNKVIERCPFNRGWIVNCYGDEALKMIGLNTVSCSGISIGSRDAILLYSYLIHKQLDPVVRWGSEVGIHKTNNACISTGMDQGFHNWLIFSGTLDPFMDITIFKQGEGPVNTIGSFFGGRIQLKFNLSEWGIVKGEVGKQAFYNWNGDLSPVVHQFDRYAFSETTFFKGQLEDKLAILEGMQEDGTIKLANGNLVW